MNKAETKLLQKREAELFLEKEQYTNWFGKESNLAKGAISAWSGVYEILELLDIECDFDLPANKEAMELIREREKLEKEEASNQEQLFDDYLETNTNNK